MSDRIYLSPPHMSGHERELMLAAFDSNWIAPLGPHVSALEQEFTEKVGTAHAVAVSSGTAALHLALLAVGVKPGDTVLTSTLTFVATANAIRYVGADPVFIDSDRVSWNMDPALLADELNEAAAANCLPAAVVAVDVFGQCANYPEISGLCSEYGVPLIEDAAESLGATCEGKPAGSLGDIGCFSFNGNKIITASGGGMIVTDQGEWAKRMLHLATQAREPVPHYEHRDVGYNYRLSNLLAAVARGQMAVLDDRVARRRQVFSFYQRRLDEIPGIEFMPEAEYGQSTRWLSCILLDEKKTGISSEKLRLALEAENIESRPLWKPMHLQPVYANCRVRGGSVSEDLFLRGLCLPSGTAMSESDLERVSNAIERTQLAQRAMAA